MQILDEHGVGEMTIEKLTTRLGVTQGSFYHHFKSHPRFLGELFQKWFEADTLSVDDALSELDLPPREMLREALRLIHQYSRANMDLHFRHLATSYPHLQGQLREVDEFRYKTIERLFRSLGFRGRKLRVRTHAFIVLNSLEEGLSEPMSNEEKLDLLDERLALFLPPEH
jgi:AcrR family transcriptional regulator